MDPEPLNHVDWRQTALALRWLLLVPVFAIGFATQMVLAHAIIPSLLDSGHVPPGLRNFLRKQRFPLYLSTCFIIGAIAFWVAEATDAAHEIRRFWHRDWI